MNKKDRKELQKLQQCQSNAQFTRFAEKHDGYTVHGGSHDKVFTADGEYVATVSRGKIAEGTRKSIIKEFIKYFLVFSFWAIAVWVVLSIYATQAAAATP